MAAIAIGPLVMAADRFAVILGIISFLAISAVLARRVDPRFHVWSWSVLIGSIIASRISHVLVHWQNFADEPWRIPALWDGGLYWPAGAGAILLTILLLLKSQQQRFWSLLPLTIALVVANTVWQLTGGAPSIPLPNISLTKFVGGTHEFGQATNKPKVINLWASWCPPCRREMPMMAEVAASAAGVEFVFANQGEDRDEVARYFSEEQLKLETVVMDRFGQLSRHYGALGLPATLFIGADGQLKHAHLGEISREKLETGINRLAGRE